APVVIPDPMPAPASVKPPAPAFSDAGDNLLADPFPASSAPASVPPPQEAAPDVAIAETTEHISGVMPAVVAVEEPEELLEDDIVEMSPTAAAPVEAVVPAAGGSLDELDFEDEDSAQPAANEEEPPVSSSRSKVAATMDEALAQAAAQMVLEEGREVPLKTPPPESGPQAAMPPMPAPPAPDIDELLEADILPVGANAGPTQEQLGQTIDLEEARGPRLELDHPKVAIAEAAHEELEVSLPQREFGGGYQDNLMPPPEARQDLDAHLQRVADEAIASPPESLAQLPSMQSGVSASGMYAAQPTPGVTTESPTQAVSTVTVEAAANAEFAPELLGRPELSPGPVAKFIRADAPRPNTFLELLDSSLTLGRD
ncbi:MAG TPA: hypothetical protein VGM44_15715, partial [Polyangiaceae bacterium]